MRNLYELGTSTLESNMTEKITSLSIQFAQDELNTNPEAANNLLLDKRGRTLAWLMRDTSRLYTGIGQKSLVPWGITMAHWYYLRVLEEEVQLNQLELSRRVGMASTSTVPVLDFLEKSELLARVRDPNDRRKYNVSLTDKGRHLIREVMAAFNRLVDDSLEGASPGDIDVVWKTILLIEANLLLVQEGSDIDC